MCKNKYAKLWDYTTGKTITHRVKLRNGRIDISDGIKWADVLDDPLNYHLSAYDKDHDYDRYLHQLRLARQEYIDY